MSVESKFIELINSRFYDGMKILAAVYDESCFYKKVNVNLWEKVLGWNTSVFDNTEWLTFVNVEDREKTKKTLDKLLEEESTAELENRLLCADGNYIWFSWNYTSHKLNNGNMVVFALGRNVNIEKMENKRLFNVAEINRLIIENASCGILVYNYYGNCFLANEAVCKILGTLSVDQVLHQNFRHMHFWQTSGMLACAEYALDNMEKKSDVFSFEVADAIRVWIEAAFLPFMFYGEKHLLLLIYDITKIKESEQQSLTLQEEAENANKAKSGFLARMSHEIRTPLNGVIGLAELLQVTEVDSQQKKYVDGIIHSSNLLLGILSDVLDISKIESGKLLIEKMEFSLTEMIKTVVLPWQYRCAQKKIDLTYRIDKKLPEWFIGDNLRIQQVLINLLSNAYKFTKSGSIEISVIKADYEASDKDKNVMELLFSVKDNGIGIEQSRQDDIFSSFAQADTSITRNYGGTGLGLAIVKQLVVLMNGDVSLQSEKGKGSTFAIKLPLTYIDVVGTKKINEQENVAIRNKNLILVGKRWLESELLLELLSRYKINVKVADNIEKTVNYLEKHCLHDQDCDYLIIDYEMLWSAGDNTVRKVFGICAKFTKKIMLGLFLSHYLVDEIDSDQLSTNKHLINIYFKKALIVEELLASFRDYEEKKNDVSDGKVKNKDSAADMMDDIRKNVLVAEDNEINMMVITEILKKNNLNIFKAFNGKEALEVFGREKCDLILMDVHMPEMDGLTAIKEIRKMEKNRGEGQIPIAVLTADALTGESEKTMEVGANYYLSKPFKQKDLLLILNELNM